MPREIYCQSILSRPRAAPAGRHSPVPPPIPGRVRSVLAARQNQISISRLAPAVKPLDSFLNLKGAASSAHSKAKHFYFQSFAYSRRSSENTKNTTSLFSTSCELLVSLFCSLKRRNLPVFMPFRSLAPKYPGWGVPIISENFDSLAPQSWEHQSLDCRLPETGPLG
jgi:hypothetical protein